MNSKDLAIAGKFKRLVLQRLNPMDMLVFGSRARGDAAADSDFDVLVVVERSNHDVERFISDCAWEAGYDHDVLIVPVVVDKARLAGPLGESLFIRNVYREGVIV